MKAITTKFIPRTETKPLRIKASDEDGNSVTVSADSVNYSFSNMEQAHQTVAQQLLAKMNWSGELIGGSVAGGFVWVFAPTTKNELGNITSGSVAATIKLLFERRGLIEAVRAYRNLTGVSLKDAKAYVDSVVR